MQKGIITTLIHLRHPTCQKNFVTYLPKVGVASLDDYFDENIVLNESKK